MREADPEVPDTVTVYVPAGVPPVVEAALLLLPQAGNSRVSARRPPSKIPRNIFLFLDAPPPIPKASRVSPETGSQVA